MITNKACKISKIQEHDPIPGIHKQEERLDNLSLVSWTKPNDRVGWGYYASYKIGAEWIDEKEALIVTTKINMENIDFLSMFMACFSSNLAVESFSQIYSIDTNTPTIEAPSLSSVLSPLIVIHFLSILNKIRTLKKGYVHHCENIRIVKGRINIQKNERLNILQKRYDRIFCEFDEYSVDIPENRLLKRALLFSQGIMSKMKYHQAYNNVRQLIAKSLILFENVSNDFSIRDVKQMKTHKLFKEYNEAVRLAKLVLKLYDYNLNKASISNNRIVPFVLDMSLLYEHYVYGLLNKAYGNKITYQFNGITGKPDFLYVSERFKAILDTKYSPKYNDKFLDNYVIRQLSGYGRDITILNQLGYNVDEESPIPSVPCIIIYPKEATKNRNPFIHKELLELCTDKVPRLSQFYKVSIPLPTIKLPNYT